MASLAPKSFHEIGTASDVPETHLKVPSGYKIISGGARINWTDPGLLLTASYPLDSQTWVAVGKAHQFSSKAAIEIWVLAVPEADWDVTIETNQSSTTAQYPDAVAKVPSGYILTGGGAQALWDRNGVGGSLLTASYPFDSESWYAKSKEHFVGEKVKIISYAIGIKAKDKSTFDRKVFAKTVSNQATFLSDNVLSESVGVDSGYTLVGGGAFVDYQHPGQLLTASYSDNGSTWHAKCKAHGQSSKASLNVYAIGLK